MDQAELTRWFEDEVSQEKRRTLGQYSAAYKSWIKNKVSELYGRCENLKLNIRRLRKVEDENKRLKEFLENGFLFKYIKFEKIDREDPAFETFTDLFGKDEAEKIAR